MRSNYIFTSESVSEGHPDKVADQISDTILDLFLEQDENARVAVETLVTTNKVVLAGECSSTANISKQDIEKAVRETVKKIGYTQDGFHYEKLSIENFIHEQSSDIAVGVNKSETELGAGDQGIMFGYACNETSTYMPSAIDYSHDILRHLSKKRKNNLISGLLPDAKAQVTLRYEDKKPVELLSIVVSHQHEKHLLLEDVKSIIIPEVKEVLPSHLFSENTKFFINPTGVFTIGGPDSDTGLTGRKIIVDTYGGYAPHGGGAFSGKDATKVDRSAAYMVRYLAKNIVAAGLATQCLIQVSYAIGVSEPLSLYVNFGGTGLVKQSDVEEYITKNISLTPSSIIEKLNLRKTRYKQTATYGHFGRKGAEEDGFKWEDTDLVDDIKKYFNV